MREIGKVRWNARIWEDGTFSFGYVPFNIANCEPQEQASMYSEETAEMLKYAIQAHGLDEMLKFIRDNPEAYPVDLQFPPLGSSTVPNSHSDIRVRGQEGISTHGKRMVRNAALRLERECGNYLLSFVTLTIPGISAQGALVVCENWSEIVRVFQQKLKRRLQRAGLPGEMVGCTEVQENRFAATNVVALHLHLVFQGRMFGGGWVLRPKEIRAMWQDTLKPYLSGLEDELYWDACENVQRVKKSASAYLGKYMSKGIKTCEAIHEAYPEIILPACWYICTNTLRRRVMQNVTLLTSSNAPSFELTCSIGDVQNVFAYIHPIVCDIGNGKLIKVGYVGKIKPSLVDSFKDTSVQYGENIPF